MTASKLIPILFAALFGMVLAGVFAVWLFAKDSDGRKESEPAAEDSVARGKALFEKHRCAVCHRDGGVGAPLAGVAGRHTREEIRTWIANPKKIKPKTIMPRFPFDEKELDAIVDYVMTLE